MACCRFFSSLALLTVSSLSVCLSVMLFNGKVCDNDFFQHWSLGMVLTSLGSGRFVVVFVVFNFVSVVSSQDAEFESAVKFGDFLLSRATE